MLCSLGLPPGWLDTEELLLLSLFEPEPLSLSLLPLSVPSVPAVLSVPDSVWLPALKLDMLLESVSPVAQARPRLATTRPSPTRARER